jgi:hypothetical protein
MLLALLVAILLVLNDDPKITVPLYIFIVPGILGIVIIIIPFIPFPAVRHRIERLVFATKRLFESLAGKLILLLVCFVTLEITILYVYADWRIVILSLAFLILTILCCRLLAKYTFSLRKETQPKFSPIPLSDIGNSYFGGFYIDPPLGNITLGGAEFQLESKSLVFDTDGPLHYFLPRRDGSIEVEINLREPIRFVKSVHLLVNSSNSKSLYAGKKIGEIELVFKDSPKVTTELRLGKNIREWCVGAPGNLVRETSDSLSKVVWQGVNRDGIYAVIDSLEIPVYPVFRTPLEAILPIEAATRAP